jgi:hypothetical protein
MLHVGELQIYKSDLAIQYHDRIGIFRKEMGSLAMSAKAFSPILGGETHMSLPCPSSV